MLLVPPMPPMPRCPPPSRYERSAAAQRLSGARITQRHVASEEDLAYAEGRGLLVRRGCRGCRGRPGRCCLPPTRLPFSPPARPALPPLISQVPLDEVDDPAVLGQQPATGDEFL